MTFVKSASIVLSLSLYDSLLYFAEIFYELCMASDPASFMSIILFP